MKVASASKSTTKTKELHDIIKSISINKKYYDIKGPTVWRVAQSPPRPITEAWARSVLGWVNAFFSATTSCDRLGVELFFLKTERGVWINIVSPRTEIDLGQTLGPCPMP